MTMDFALPLGKKQSNLDSFGKGRSPVAATSTLTDTVLVSRAAEGDHIAFSELVTRHYRRCLRVAYGMIKNRHDAEDITQEAFAKAYRRLPKFEGKSAFYTWIYRIVVNLCIDRMRKKKRRKGVDSPTDSAQQRLKTGAQMWAPFNDSSPESRRLRQDTLDQVKAAFSALPEIHQAVIVLREIEGQSYEAIAETLGVKKGTVMSRLFHARKAMQATVAVMEAEESARMNGEQPQSALVEASNV